MWWPNTSCLLVGRYHVIDPVSGTNTSHVSVFSYRRAPRGDGIEAVVLHASTKATHSVGLVLGMAKYFNGVDFWSKNLIVLLTETEHGVDAFLQAYGGRRLGRGIISEPLEERIGVIHSALSVAVHRTRFETLTVQTTGINSRKPNLDFVQGKFTLFVISARNLRVNMLLADPTSTST